MKMIGMGHIAVNAGNYEKSLEFYRDILGLIVEDTTDWGDFQLTNLRMPDGGLLELFDYGPRDDRAESDESVVGYRHFAFAVEDVRAWHEKLIENGVEIQMAPLEMPELGIIGLLCRDPDGIVIELSEPL